jgi:tRNA pseudouridine38-40 synthase
LTFDKGKIWRVSQSLDLAGMQTAAHMLLGTHDFSTFRDGQCQAKSPIKTLDRFDLTRANGPFGPEIHARLEARSFLHRQVRSMMGSLCEVGKGRWTPADLKSALLAANRTHCGPVAPPDGLYLVGVGY